MIELPCENSQWLQDVNYSLKKNLIVDFSHCPKYATDIYGTSLRKTQIHEKAKSLQRFHRHICLNLE